MVLVCRVFYMLTISSTDIEVVCSLVGISQRTCAACRSHVAMTAPSYPKNMSLTADPLGCPS